MFSNNQRLAGDSASVLSASTSRRSLLRAMGLGAVALGGAGALAACGNDAAPTSAATQGGGSGGGLTEPTAFKIASAPGDNYFLDAVCAEQKLFDKHKLDVGEFVFPQSGVQAMQLFAAGAINGMQQDTVLTMASFAKGQKGKRPVIVGMRIPETTYSIVVNKGSWPAASASFDEKMNALKGKKIGVAAVGAGSDQQLRLALEAAGMKYDDVTHLGVGQFTPGIAQMRAGRIDAYVAVTFATSQLMAQASGGQSYLEFWSDDAPAILNKQQVQPIIVREDFLADSMDVVNAWKSAAWEGKDWILANREEAANKLNETQFGGKGAAAATAYIEHYATSVVPKIHPDWKVEKAGIEVMIGVAEKLGAVKPGQVTYEDIVADFARA
jgi:ABC-type nitrate/sulfonate/bicarbonate transport system substrate-binding protein